MKPSVIAIRIYCDFRLTPMADLKMSDGVIETIQWNNAKERAEFAPYISGYTLFYDEREKGTWDDL